MTTNMDNKPDITHLILIENIGPSTAWQRMLVSKSVNSKSLPGIPPTVIKQVFSPGIVANIHRHTTDTRAN